MHVFGSWLFQVSIETSFDTFESGKAEALGTLCKIMQEVGDEEILPAYLARFYLSIQANLSDNTVNEITANIIVNSSKLFTLNLDGVHVLLPNYINSLGYLTRSEKNLKMPHNSCISSETLRKRGIELLITMLSYPDHFGNHLFNTGELNQEKKHTAFEMKKK